MKKGRKIKKITFGWLPGAALVAAFFALRSSTAFMNTVELSFSRPFRSVLSRLSAKLPFCLTEILLAIGIIWLLVFLVRTVVLLFSAGTRHVKGRFVLRRISVLLTVAIYIWAAFLWLWSVSCFSLTFCERTGFERRNISVEELYNVTVMFAQKANHLSTQVQRDENGLFAEEDYFPAADYIYESLQSEIPVLEGFYAAPKAPVVSYIMSIAGYTGLYFPYTGESNINVHAPKALQPAVIGHELAHQLGVAMEDECNFLGVAACLSSDNTAYEYSGSLYGLIHLSNALYSVSPELFYELAAGFTPELAADWNENSRYWQEMEGPVDEVVDKVYDAYLKGSAQEEGLRSYGLCVDMLVIYYMEKELL